MATDTAEQLQVAGHPGGIASHDGGRKITKKTSKYEAEFYEICHSEASEEPAGSALNRLKALMPKYFGKNDLDDITEKPDEVSIIIENLTHGFKHPNILDVKLGKQLWDERASQEKRERMDANSKVTTSWTEGLRLTGWQVWDNDTKQTVSTSKTFGKTISAKTLPIGLRLFFGCASIDHWAAYADVVKGKEDVAERGPASLPGSTVLQVLKLMLPQIEEVESIFETLELRMRGGSLLLIYEGDQTTLIQALQKTQSSHANPLALVKLIDFAHARLAPGEGPDEGVLTGVRTFKSLVKNLVTDLGEGLESRR